MGKTIDFLFNFFKEYIHMPVHEILDHIVLWRNKMHIFIQAVLLDLGSEFFISYHIDDCIKSDVNISVVCM